MERIEQTILRRLMQDEVYARKVLPFLKEDYFVDRKDRIIFNQIQTFLLKYNASPTKETLIIELSGVTFVDQTEFTDIATTLATFDAEKSNEPDPVWLLDATEKFCQEKAIYIAVLSSINILEGKEKKLDKGAIPKLLQDALAITFDPSVGHDYFEDSDKRLAFYKNKESRLPFASEMEYFNTVTAGGLPAKTLNVIMAGTGIGKTLFMCSAAAGHMKIGKNVLYITMEMAEERIAERIDANLLDRPLDTLKTVDDIIFKKEMVNLTKNYKGRLIVKEFPTATAHAGHFRILLHELKLKKKFVPDVIYIDYLSICASERIKQSGGGTYELVKSIAEEIRGLAVEFNVPIITATQTNRSGFQNSDVDLTNVAESFGLPATADFFLALFTDDEVRGDKQYIGKILKNRYAHIPKKLFAIGVDRSRMRIFDIDNPTEGFAITENKPNKNKSNPPQEIQTSFKDRFNKFKFL